MERGVAAGGVGGRSAGRPSSCTKGNRGCSSPDETGSYNAVDAVHISNPSDRVVIETVASNTSLGEIVSPDAQTIGQS